MNLLITLIAVVLFSFSCFCISRMTQTSKRRLASPAFFSVLGLQGSKMTGAAVLEKSGKMWEHDGCLSLSY